MKAAFNQNDIKLYPIDNEFINECKGCLFLRAISSNSYDCRLFNFETGTFETLFHCFQSIFIPEPLSDIFKI